DAHPGGGVAAAGGDLAGAVEEEALGDVVGVVVDEGFLDQLVEIVEGNLERRLLERLGGEIGGDFADNGADEGAGLGGEDVALFAAGEVDVGDGVAEGFGDFGEVELGFAL